MKAYQQKHGLTVDGNVDDALWTALTGEPIPPLRERRLGCFGSETDALLHVLSQPWSQQVAGEGTVHGVHYVLKNWGLDETS